MLANAIFTSNLAVSLELLRSTIWSPHLDAAAFNAILSRADTSFDYVRALMADPPAGWSRERMLGHLLNPRAPTLKSVIANQKSNTGPDPPTEEAAQMPWIPLRQPATWDSERDHCFWLIYYRVLGAHYLLHAYKRFNTQVDRFFEHKVQRFLDAHVQCCMLLDAGDVTMDALIAAYGGGLGESHYPCDAEFIQMSSREHILKPTPYSQIAHLLTAAAAAEDTAYLREPGEEEEWAPFPDAKRETHSILFKLVAQLNACMQHMSEDHPLSDQLWLYYVSWTDLFHYCLRHGRMDDEFLLLPIGSKRDARLGHMQLGDTASPWTLFGGWAQQGTRTFCADDLPDLYGMLVSIPLRGEQHTPRYVLGKIYQKALPFACGRRHIIKLVNLALTQEPGVWPLFRALCWTMLANLYPGELASPHGMLGMRDLLRIKELTDDRQALMSALAVREPSPSGAPLIVFTLFRLHIIHMASFNPQYVAQASECIDWPFFVADSIKLARLVREHRLFAADCFATARLHLGKTVKTPNARVHRMRRRSLAVSLMDHFNERLEKSLLKTMRAYQQEQRLLVSLTADRYFGSPSLMAAYVQQQLKDNSNAAMDAQYWLDESRETVRVICERYERALNVRCKSAILNALIALPPEQRMTGPAFAMLKAQEMGGVSDQCVALLCDLVRTYEQKAAPKEFKQRIGQLELDHFMVVCFYFNAAALVERISFVALDADTVQRTDMAMTARLVPGTPFDVESSYSVYIALCCERVCTLSGNGKYGNRKVAYDIERQCYICAAGKKHADDPLASHLDDEERDNDIGGARDDDDDDHDGSADDEDLLGQMQGAVNKRTRVMQERKAIRNMRKRFSRIPCGQPVLQVTLRGRALVWGNTADNKRQYMFCPQCASLHLFSMLGFSDSEFGYYRCPECARRELMHLSYHTCAYCKRIVNSDEDYCDIYCPNVDDARHLLQRLYFCKVHLRIVQRHSTLPRPQLWQRIKQLQDARSILHAGGNHKSQTDRNIMLGKTK